ncbi:hypothetical protein [Streptococcus suis]
MTMIARKRPIAVWATRYDHSVILDEFLKFLRSNEEEPVRYDETDGTIYIQKERGEIALPKGNWVISEVNTDKRFWSIDPKIFQKTYERVEGVIHSFRKKVYEVECIELKSLDAKDVRPVLEFLGYRTNGDVLNILHMDEIIEDCQLKGCVPVDTLEGIEALYPTEILIKGVEGEFYPVKRDNFDKVYDIIGEI